MSNREIFDSWKKYNEASSQLFKLLNLTNNHVGDFAEYLTAKLFNGTILPASNKSSDVKDEHGLTYQVKARRIANTFSTQLGSIRSWDFDFLIIVLFGENGEIKLAKKVSKDVAYEYAATNKHQNSKVLSTTKIFLNDPRIVDLTESFKLLYP